jgi:hypothetical protein
VCILYLYTPDVFAVSNVTARKTLFMGLPIRSLPLRSLVNSHYAYMHKDMLAEDVRRYSTALFTPLLTEAINWFSITMPVINIRQQSHT